MDTTPSPKAGATPTPVPPGLPNFKQMVALALAMAEKSLAEMSAICTSDEHWADDDNDVDDAVALALCHIERMSDMTFDGHEAFDKEWLKAQAAINMGTKLFSRGNCRYAYALKNAAGLLVQLGAMVEFVEPA